MLVPNSQARRKTRSSQKGISTMTLSPSLAE